MCWSKMSLTCNLSLPFLHSCPYANDEFLLQRREFISVLLICGLTPAKIKLVQKFSVIGCSNNLMWSVIFSTGKFDYVNCITPCYTHKFVLFMKAKKVMLSFHSYILVGLLSSFLNSIPCFCLSFASDFTMISIGCGIGYVIT